MYAIGTVPSVNFVQYSKELFGVSVSETTRFALSLPLLRSGPLPFTSPRAAMVSDTDTPKSSVKLDYVSTKGTVPIVYLVQLETLSLFAEKFLYYF